MGEIGLESSLFPFHLDEARGYVADGVCLLSPCGINFSMFIKSRKLSLFYTPENFK